MAIPFETAVAEDLNLGHGTADVTMPGGGTAVGTKIGLHTFFSSSVFNVRDFGAHGDGVTDDTTAIQAAIDACVAAGGGQVFIPSGIFLVSTTLDVHTSDIHLVGAGGNANTNTGTIGAATVLRWTGAQDGILLQFASVSGASNQGVKRVGASGLFLDGNAGLAGYLLWVQSIRFGCWKDLTLWRPRLACLYTDVVAELGETRDTQHCTFENLNIRACSGSLDGTAHQSAQGIKITGDTVSNTSYCHFRNIEVIHMKGVGINLFLSADSNKFWNVTTRCTDTVGSTVHGVFLDGDNVSTPGNNRVVYNVFYNLSAQANNFGGGVQQLRVGADDWNALVDYDIGQGVYLPTITAGKMAWNTHGQAGFGFAGIAGVSAIRREIGGLVIGTSALATTAVDGFLYLPTCAGTPTGTPTAWDSAKAVVYDTTANKLWVYNGSWRGVAVT